MYEVYTKRGKDVVKETTRTDKKAAQDDVAIFTGIFNYRAWWVEVRDGSGSK